MKNAFVVFICGLVAVAVLYGADAIGILGALGLIMLTGIIAAIVNGNAMQAERKEKRQKANDDLKELENFTPSKKLVDAWGLIAVDDESEQIALKVNQGKIFLYPYSDIIRCEVIENGKTVFSKSGMVGRAIVGGALAGGTGAVIGGLTAKSNEVKEFESVDFKILLRNSTIPVFTIRFFSASEETMGTKKTVNINDKTYGPKLRTALHQLNNWKETIEVIIDKVNSKPEVATATAVSSSSVADELSKLNELREKGILSADEFETQKKKILSA